MAAALAAMFVLGVVAHALWVSAPREPMTRRWAYTVGGTLFVAIPMYVFLIAPSLR